MTDLVDQIFPPIHRKWAPEFTDFNYWKVPVQDFTLPDLTPPSPALSARSDTSSKSALARIRNFSLVGSRHSETKPLSLPPPVTSSGRTTPEVSGREQRSSELKQMSSFERLNSTLFSLTGSSTSWKEYRRRSVSPSSSSTCLDSEEEDEPGAGSRAGGRRMRRTRSITSMPGSLDDMHLESNDEEDPDVEGNFEQERGEVEEAYCVDEAEAAENAFDEDFF